MSDDTLEKTFSAALEHHRHGDLAVAEDLYKEVLRAAPAHSLSLHNLSLLYQQSGRGAEIIGLLRVARPGPCVLWAITGGKTGGSAMATAKFLIGMPVRHRLYGFRGVIFDVDPTFGNTEEWYQSIPEKMRPRKDQPFYHLFAVNADQSPYIAYVSEQNLVEDENEPPIHHPGIDAYFERTGNGRFLTRDKAN